ncbi:MAG: hypothetical protein NUV91_00345 [Candidatus Omnitrophica bacterium]|nr:hypothetical protein [Candidatus Omnitrophota bacterium]
MKNMTIPVAVAVAIIGCILAVSANVTTIKVRENLDRERYKRFAAEESLQKTQTQLQRLEAELSLANGKLTSIEDVINEGKSVRSDLQNEVDRLQEEKTLLEGQIQSLQGQVSGGDGMKQEQQGSP